MVMIIYRRERIRVSFANELYAGSGLRGYLLIEG